MISFLPLLRLWSWILGSFFLRLYSFLWFLRLQPGFFCHDLFHVTSKTQVDSFTLCLLPLVIVPKSHVVWQMEAFSKGCMFFVLFWMSRCVLVSYSLAILRSASLRGFCCGLVFSFYLYERTTLRRLSGRVNRALEYIIASRIVLSSELSRWKGWLYYIYIGCVGFLLWFTLGSA